MFDLQDLLEFLDIDPHKFMCWAFGDVLRTNFRKSEFVNLWNQNHGHEWKIDYYGSITDDLKSMINMYKTYENNKKARSV